MVDGFAREARDNEERKRRRADNADRRRAGLPTLRYPRRPREESRGANPLGPPRRQGPARGPSTPPRGSRDARCDPSPNERPRRVRRLDAYGCSEDSGGETEGHHEKARADEALVTEGPSPALRALAQTSARRYTPAHADAIGDTVHLNSTDVAMGLYAESHPVRVSELTQGERAYLDGSVVPHERGHIRRGVKGWAHVSTFTARKPRTIKTHVRYWNVYVLSFCDLEGYDPWIANATTWELFAGHMYEEGTVGSIDKFASAINYVHKAFRKPERMIGGRFQEAKEGFRKACTLRKTALGLMTHRALIPDHGMLHLLRGVLRYEEEENWLWVDRGFSIIAKCLTWVRAVSIGASVPGDFCLGPDLDRVIITIRKTKCGPEEFVPIQLSIPFPELGDGNEVAAVVMGIVRRTLTRHPRICAASLGLTPSSAAGKMTTWMRELMPMSILMLPPGHFISSHSSRDTGATHARRSIYPSCGWDTVMSWGGWLTELRCKGYIKVIPGPSDFWRQFYYWLSPTFARKYNFFPRVGYAEEKNDGSLPGGGEVVFTDISLPIPAGALLQCPGCRAIVKTSDPADMVSCPTCASHIQADAMLCQTVHKGMSSSMSCRPGEKPRRA